MKALFKRDLESGKRQDELSNEAERRHPQFTYIYQDVLYSDLHLCRPRKQTSIQVHAPFRISEILISW